MINKLIKSLKGFLDNYSVDIKKPYKPQIEVKVNSEKVKKVSNLDLERKLNFREEFLKIKELDSFDQLATYSSSLVKRNNKESLDDYDLFRCLKEVLLKLQNFISEDDCLKFTNALLEDFKFQNNNWLLKKQSELYAKVGPGKSHAISFLREKLMVDHGIGVIERNMGQQFAESYVYLAKLYLKTNNLQEAKEVNNIAGMLLADFRDSDYAFAFLCYCRCNTQISIALPGNSRKKSFQIIYNTIVEFLVELSQDIQFYLPNKLMQFKKGYLQKSFFGVIQISKDNPDTPYIKALKELGLYDKRIEFTNGIINYAFGELIIDLGYPRELLESISVYPNDDLAFRRSFKKEHDNFLELRANIEPNLSCVYLFVQSYIESFKSS